MQDQTVCSACGGTRRTIQGGARKACWKCLGDGFVRFIKVTCNRCYGNGVIDQGVNNLPLKCPTCEGEGTVKEPGR